MPKWPILSRIVARSLYVLLFQFNHFVNEKRIRGFWHILTGTVKTHLIAQAWDEVVRMICPRFS
jgi:hypothetical protein